MGRPPDSHTSEPSRLSRAMYSCFLSEFSLRLSYERTEGTRMMRCMARTYIR